MVSKNFTGSQGKKRDACRPIRTCVGCRKKEESQLLASAHCVKNPDGDRTEIIFNAQRTNGIKVSGRGAWLHYDSVCFSKAVKRNAFSVSFKAQERKINFRCPTLTDFEKTIMIEEAGRNRMRTR